MSGSFMCDQGKRSGEQHAPQSSPSTSSKAESLENSHASRRATAGFRVVYKGQTPVCQARCRRQHSALACMPMPTKAKQLRTL